MLNPIGHSTNLYAAGGLTPTFVNHQRGRSRATPMLLYRWEDTEKALNRLRQYEGSPYDGVMLEYTNPINGEPVTTTMSFLVQLLRPGEHTKRHRHTSSTAYCCLKGKGKTIVGDKTLEWGQNDMFVIPSWAWHNMSMAAALRTPFFIPYRMPRRCIAWGFTAKKLRPDRGRVKISWRDVIDRQERAAKATNTD